MAIQRLTACPVVSVFASRTVGTKLTRTERATFTQHRKVNVDELLEVVTRAYKYQRVNPAVQTPQHRSTNQDSPARYSLNPTERKAVTIDHLIMAAGADVHHISGVIQEERSRIGGYEAGLLAYTNAPAVVSKAIAHALTPEGHKDRNMLLRIAGVIPL
jgi:hypothetical protein